MKAFLKKRIKSRLIKRILEYVYHEGRWLLERMIISKSHPSAKIVRLRRKKIGEIRQQGYRSQFGQDYFIDKIISNKIEHGTFVDIGANDPEYNNNTFYFEAIHNWDGVAIEPQKRYVEAWKEKRKAKFINCCIGKESSTVQFLQYESPNEWEDQLSCVSDMSREEDSHLESKTIAVKMRPFSEIAAKNGLNEISLMSIDVEGYEIEVLKGIDFQIVRPKVILIENCRKLAGDEEIRNMLLNVGYVFAMRIWTVDDLFLEKKFADSLN